MLKKDIEPKTESGDLNLNGVIEKYFDWYCREHSFDRKKRAETGKKYNEVICPNVKNGIPATAYTDINQLNLSNLFKKVMKAGEISSKAFFESYAPLITEPLAHYLEECLSETDTLWGAWYKAETYPGGPADCERDLYESTKSIYTLTEREIRKIADAVLREDAPGEHIGYALMLLTGASIDELWRIKYADIFTLFGSKNDRLLHMMGSFPKFTVPVDDDIRPRFVPLPDKLSRTLENRLELIKSELSFPVYSEYGTYNKVEDLPVLCSGKDYIRPCTLHEFSMSACSLLRGTVGYSEHRMALMNRTLLQRPVAYKHERSGALYTARWTYDLILFRAGVDSVMMKYLCGKPMGKDETDRSFTGTEWMKETKQLIENELML